MNIAVLGTGFGETHVQIYKRQSNVTNIIVWGRNQEKLTQFEKDYQVKTTSNLDDIWKDEYIDLVDICLPNKLHASTAVKAMESGKHVYIETPIAENDEDASLIVETAKRTGKLAFVDLFMRHDFANDYLYQTVKSGEYGKLKSLSVWRDTPPWWGNLDLSEIGINLMIHDVDFICHLLGTPTSLKTSCIQVRENESIVHTLMQYNDAFASLEGSSAMPGAHPFSIGYDAIFEKAALHYYEDGYENNRLDTKLSVFTANERKVIPLASVDCHEHAILHVLACLEGKVENEMSAGDAALALHTVLAMNASMNA